MNRHGTEKHPLLHPWRGIDCDLPLPRNTLDIEELVNRHFEESGFEKFDDVRDSMTRRGGTSAIV